MPPYSNIGKVLLRRQVARLMARGYETVEIINMLRQPALPNERGEMVANPWYFVNPKTNRPYSVRRIYAIARELQDEWARLDAARLALERGELLGANRRIVQEAWEKGDFQTVLAALAQRMAILGLGRQAPAVSLSVDIPWDKLPTEALERLAAGDPPEAVLRDVQLSSAGSSTS